MNVVRAGWCKIHNKPPINDKHECMDCHPEKEREEIWCPECKRWTLKWGHQGAFLCSHGDHMIRMMTTEDWKDVAHTPIDPFHGYPKDTFKAEKTLTQLLKEEKQ